VDAGIRWATAVVFVWLGMVLAISFIEAPLKFRAPGVTVKIGLGIGRLVFRALSACEFVFLLVIAFVLFTHDTSPTVNVALCFVGGTLLAQTLLVRPQLARRTAAVLDGDEGARSRAHHAYIGLEIVKVVALVWAGVLLTGA
jgi:hypothetical protein